MRWIRGLNGDALLASVHLVQVFTYSGRMLPFDTYWSAPHCS